MGNFNVVKHGYDEGEVDSYIDKMRYNYESRLSEQKDRIFYLKDQIEKITSQSDDELMSSLVSAVERARMIESSSKNIYELEMKKLNLLYIKIEELLKDDEIIIDKSKRKEFLLLIEDCRNSLQRNIQAQQENLRESLAGDPVRRLLSKMLDSNRLSVTDVKPAIEKEILTQQTSGTTIRELPQKRPPEIANRQVRIVTPNRKMEGKLKPDLGELDSFLSKSSKTTNGTNFESIMFSQKGQSKTEPKIETPLSTQEAPKYHLAPNSSGFDLKEAVNPKEGLDEIMKAFDFFNDNKKNSN